MLTCERCHAATAAYVEPLEDGGTIALCAACGEAHQGPHDERPVYTTRFFHQLPIGTRFVYHGALWQKLALEAAENIEAGHPQRERVHCFNAMADVDTA